MRITATAIVLAAAFMVGCATCPPPDLPACPRAMFWTEEDPLKPETEYEAQWKATAVMTPLAAKRLYELERYCWQINQARKP